MSVGYNIANASQQCLRENLPESLFNFPLCNLLLIANNHNNNNNKLSLISMHVLSHHKAHFANSSFSILCHFSQTQFPSMLSIFNHAQQAFHILIFFFRNFLAARAMVNGEELWPFTSCMFSPMLLLHLCKISFIFCIVHFLPFFLYECWTLGENNSIGHIARWMKGLLRILNFYHFSN